MKEIVFSKHAKDTMSRRGANKADVYQVLARPQTVVKQDRFKGRPTPGQAVYSRDSLAVVAREYSDVIVVITVLLRDYTPGQRWTDEDVRNRSRS